MASNYQRRAAFEREVKNWFRDEHGCLGSRSAGSKGPFDLVLAPTRPFTLLVWDYSEPDKTSNQKPNGVARWLEVNAPLVVSCKTALRKEERKRMQRLNVIGCIKLLAYKFKRKTRFEVA